MKLKSACRGGWIALLAAAADRASKAWMSGHSGEIPGLVRFRTVLNTGVAFSFLENAGWALAADGCVPSHWRAPPGSSCCAAANPV